MHDVPFKIYGSYKSIEDVIYCMSKVPFQDKMEIGSKSKIPSKKPLWKTPHVQEEIRLPPLPTFEYDETIDGTGTKYEERMPTPQKDPFVPDEQAA
mmetsp:Transcript_26582/g.34647  ORF Transcript_26582/g.34647 Transcript_26582/m.34647 type:complete len:96 (+) Transcript_26582:394-681(+)